MHAQTTVRQLTAINVKAVEELGVADKLGATYAVFPGNPEFALQLVEAAIGNGNRRAIAAVVRKLAEGADNKHVSVNIEAADAQQNDDEAAEDQAVAQAEAAAAVEQDQPADEQADEQPVADQTADAPAQDYTPAVELGDVVMAQHPEAGRATRALIVATGGEVRAWFPQLGGPDSDRATAAVTGWTRARRADEVSKSWVRRARRALDSVELDGDWARVAQLVTAADDANRGQAQD